jgi:ribosome-binding protein aMBF1 (putative translation factor)
MATFYYPVTQEGKRISTNGYYIDEDEFEKELRKGIWIDFENMFPRKSYRKYRHTECIERAIRRDEEITKTYGSKLEYYTALQRMKEFIFMQENAELFNKNKLIVVRRNTGSNAGPKLKRSDVRELTADFNTDVDSAVSYHHSYLDGKDCTTISRMRQDKNMTQEQIAKSLNINVNVYRDYENSEGMYNPNLVVLSKIRKLLGIEERFRITKPQNITETKRDDAVVEI